MKIKYKNIIKILVSIIILVYIFFKIDFKKILLLLKEINCVYLIFALILLFVSLILMVLKWSIVLKKYFPFKFKRIFFTYWASDFINIFGLGAVGGETYKMLSFDNKKKALLTSLFDKILSFYWYLILGISFLSSFLIIGKDHVATIIIFGFIFYALMNLITLILNFYRKMIIKIIPIIKIKNFLNKINFENRDLIFHSFISLCIIINTALMYSLVFKSLHLGFIIVQLIIFIPILKIAVALPISFGGVGVREFLFVEFAKIISINVELALLSSFIIYFLSMIYRISGMVPFIFYSKRK